MKRKSRTSKSEKGAERNDSLHGNAPDSALVALLLVDVICDFDFPGGKELLKQAVPAARRILTLKKRANQHGVPTIYANDNYGRWRSNFAHLVDHCRAKYSAGAAITDMLAPRENDYFVLKPKHSGFYQTCLGLLLEHLQIKTLVICGFSTESCVTFTAHDAYLRDYHIVIPRDTTAARNARRRTAALEHLRFTLGARTPASRSLSFDQKNDR